MVSKFQRGFSIAGAITGRFGPIPVRTPGRFGLIPFRSGRFGLGRFGPISGVGRFGPTLGGSFRPTLFYLDFYVLKVIPASLG